MVDDTDVGGASYEAYAAHALANIAAGRCNVALLTYGDNPSAAGRAVGTRVVGTRRRDERAPRTFPANYLELPWGMPLVGNYALVARRHMHQYGTKPEQLAEIAVAVRQHASRNPNAKYRDPISVDDVINSRMIADPLHMLDCCVVSDGGGAVVIVSPEVARTCKTKPAYLLGVGEGYQHTSMGDRDITYIAAHYSNGPAWAMADVKPEDVDILMVYDSFTITALCTIEDLGFCKKGDGGSFVEGGRLTLEGSLPLNTDGGGLSSNHPGRRGIFLLIEATRQLRGESTSQVKDARIAMAHGTGGYLTTRHSGETVILGRE
jgi:acetyl-CoA C-acetyltransferase